MKKKVFRITFVLVICLLANVCLELNCKYGAITGSLPNVTIDDNFPSSYETYLEDLREKHPNWIFKAVHTGLDWNEVLKHESYEVNEGISLVPDSFGPEWKKDGQNIYKDGNFVIASKSAVGYTLDPRNFFNESSIFQFETLNFSGNAHNKDVVEKVLWGTSIWNRSEYQSLGKMIQMNKTYSEIIMGAGQKYNISPIHIASRMIQETGGDIIGNKSINGSTYVDDKIPYNFFNIGATPDSNGNNAVRNGLIRAKNESWFDPESSIYGGVSFLGASYINRGQNTIYFQKFDVNNEKGLSALCAHQYMTNITAPTGEGSNSYKGYKNAGMLSSSFEFRIPVYENMPNSPARLDDTYEYEKDATYLEVYNCYPVKLNIRSGPGTSYPIIGNAVDGDIILRIGKGRTSQWDKVRLNNGIEGYANTSYLKNTNIPNIALFDDCFIINRGDILTLSPFFSNIKDPQYNIVIDNPLIATVENGKIIGKREGQTAFYLKLEGTDKEAKGYLKVEDHSEIQLNVDSYQVGIGEVVDLQVSVTGTQNSTYEINIDNPVVATVENGKIKALNQGQTAFYLTLENSNKQVKGYLKVEDNRSISFNQDCYFTGLDQTVDLDLKISGTIQDYDIEIENPGVAKVENGKIKGIRVGQTAFYVNLKGLPDRRVKGYLKVEDNRSISFNQDCYFTGLDQTVELNLKITGSVKEYDIEIENPGVAIVENGKIKGIRVGQTAFYINLKGLPDRKVKGYLKVEDNRSISFNQDCYFTGLDEIVELDLKILGSIKDYNIEIENSGVAKVENGKIKGIRVGQTAFYVNLKGLPDRKVKGYLKVEDNRSISFNQDCYITGIEETFNLDLKITGSIKDYDIEIENSGVAKVENGKIKGIRVGQTAFYVNLRGLPDRRVKGYLKVIDNTTLSLLNENYIAGIGENIDVKFRIDGPNKKYTIDIDNPIVASSEGGKIKGLMAGQTKFTIKLQNSSQMVVGYLKVLDNTFISLLEENYTIDLYQKVDLKLKIDGPNLDYYIMVDNPVVATIENQKNMIGINVGQTKFSVNLNNSEKMVTGYLKVIDSSSIILNEVNYFSNVGEFINLDISIFGPNQEYDIIIDNPIVAEVIDGKIKATCKGQTKFTLKLKGTGKTAIGYLKVD